jgi:hypothetical protein
MNVLIVKYLHDVLNYVLINSLIEGTFKNVDKRSLSAL